MRKNLLKIRYGVLQRFLYKFFHQKPTAQVYLALNDPYSYMLVQVLPSLAQRFNIKFVLRLTYNNSPEMSAEQGNWLKWSIRDANALAEQYQLNKITSFPSSKALVTGQQLWILQAHSIDKAVTVFEKTWNDDFEDYYSLSTPVINYQINNQHKQSSQGHYMPATILFSGEWFWGIDRLDHLEQKLIATNFSRQATEPYFTKNKLLFHDDRDGKNNSSTLTMYLSLRSPYSYLGLIQVQRLAEHYQLDLSLKLVLPMVMRGLNVSQDKKRYIYFDALREGNSEDIQFGVFRDPLGQGIINCYQLFAYAEKENKALPYLLAMFDAVYVKGIDLTNVKNMMVLCNAIDIDYQQAITFDETHPWQQWQSENQQQLTQMNFWGVPCFKYQQVECWGQDRLWQIEAQIIKSSDNTISEASMLQESAKNSVIKNKGLTK